VSSLTLNFYLRELWILLQDRAFRRSYHGADEPWHATAAQPQQLARVRAVLGTRAAAPRVCHVECRGSVEQRPPERIDVPGAHHQAQVVVTQIRAQIRGAVVQ
jgi:hypothetical protein